MSALALTAAMEKLEKLHKSLYELTVKKTEIVKKGDMDALNKLIKDEQTHLTTISLVEKERHAAAVSIIPDMEQPTVTDCLARLESSEKQKLESIRDNLLEVVTQIQEQNQLNQHLIYQSMHFVNFSLSLVAPQPANYNYGPQTGKQKQPGQSPGMFNSKA